MDEQNRYGRYCKPKLQQLLTALKLDLQYHQASGNYLITADGTKILDFVGGFGATILGHNHPELKNVITDAIAHDLAVHAQGSVRSEAAILAERLSQLASKDVRYLVNFSNSGTESVEAALKHAYKKHFDRIRREYERISRTLENFYVKLYHSDNNIEIPNGKTLNKFRDDLDEYNLGQFENFMNNPHVIAFNGSFHGKSTSALKMTFNKSYREPFEGMSAIRPHFINPDNPDRIKEIVQSQVCIFYYPVLHDNLIEIRSYQITAVIGLIMEILRGEGGIRPIPEDSFQYLADNYDTLSIPLIIDEVQTGCGRLGSFYAYHLTPLNTIAPDYIVLSKALGGGLCKIGATLIREDIYDQDFSILHTSTFGEDALSAKVANRVIDILSENSFALCDRIREMGEYLRKELLHLQDDFNNLILDIRGMGLMFGIEFSELNMCSPFFRATGKQGVLALLISSYLLTYHNIRVLAPLTNMLKGNPGKKRLSVIRIQPSAYISRKEIDRLISALREVLNIIKCNNEYALIYHLVDDQVHEKLRVDCTHVPVVWPVCEQQKGIDSRTGFVAHPVSIDNLIEYYFPSFELHTYDPEKIITWWNLVSRFLEPVHCRSDYITSQGFVIENNIVLIPYLPGYINQANKPQYLIREMKDKVQDGVTIAKELGDDNIPVTMVGLGAYTSIITNNGTDINDYEVPITTGNAYTTALTVQGIFRACEIMGLDIETVDVAIIGAAGNIGTVLSQILAFYAGRLLLVGSGSNSSLIRLQGTRRICYEEIVKTVSSPDRATLRGLSLQIMQLLKNACPGSEYYRVNREIAAESPNFPELAKILDNALASDDDVQDPIRLSTDIESIKACDIVIIATNSADPELVKPDMVKEEAIICCASMPSNISTEFDSRQADYFAFDGGQARLPEDSEINFVGMPKNQMAYGCLCETLLMGFDGQNHSFCKGQFGVEQVYKTIELAGIYGFEPGDLTLHNQKISNSSRFMM